MLTSLLDTLERHGVAPLVRPRPPANLTQIPGAPVTATPAAAATRSRWQAPRTRFGLGAAAVLLLSLGLRLAFAGQQTAYMDEASYILTGRLLLEEGVAYKGALQWTYGWYLWPVLAGAADRLGGLVLVRGITALLGTVMVMAAALAAVELTPPGIARGRRMVVALLAGLAVALFPTAVGISRLGTYDALSAASFMAGATCLLWAQRRGNRAGLLAGAGLLFVGFLAKFLVAIYFPFACAYVLFATRNRAAFARGLAWFVLPLSAACMLYAVAFRPELESLLQYALGSTVAKGDLRSDDPLREYLWQRLDLWLLAGLAALGWRDASRRGRVVALAGAGIMLAFHLTTRADHDFWKHSVFPVFFLAPLAALASVRWQHRTGTARVVVATAAVVLIPWAAALGLGQAIRQTVFYTNLAPSLGAIHQETAGARRVLTDDGAVRYYLYPRLGVEQVIDPFHIDYGGQHGVDGYRSALRDRYFDVVILAGGVAPQAEQLRDGVAEVLAQYYEPSPLTGRAGDGGAVRIYWPRPEVAGVRETTGQPLDVADAAGRWGARPDNGDLQPGRGVAPSHEQPLEGRPSLAFTAEPSTTGVGTPHEGTLSELRAWVYIPSVERTGDGVQVGLYVFDEDWGWRDNGFKNVVLPGRWTEIRWRPEMPLTVREIGVKLPDYQGTVYISQVSVAP